MKNYKIRKARYDEMGFIMSMAQNEGWNPGIYDCDSFYNADPDGFFVGVLGDELIAAISAVSYGQDYAFMGLYIVKEEYRGQGYGIEIWKHAINHLKGYNIGLDGVVERQSDYVKYGFQIAYRNVRYQGLSSKQNIDNNNIVELGGVNIHELLSYDQEVFSVLREDFLRSWINQKESLSLIFIEDKKIKGYGMIRKCFQGYKIGPLFADNSEIANDLFYSLIDFPKKILIFI